MMTACRIAAAAVWLAALAVGWPAVAAERQTISKPVFQASISGQDTCLDQAAVKFTDVLNRAVEAGLVTAAEPGKTKGYNLLVAAEPDDGQIKIRQNLDKELLGYLAGAKKCLDEVLEDNRKKNLQTLIASRAPFEARLKAFATYSLCMRQRYIGGSTLWLYLSGGHQPPAPEQLKKDEAGEDDTPSTTTTTTLRITTTTTQKGSGRPGDGASGDSGKDKGGFLARLVKAWQADPLILLMVALVVGLPLGGLAVWLAWLRKTAAAGPSAEPKEGDPPPPEDGRPPLEAEHLAEALAPKLAKRLVEPLADGITERLGGALAGRDRAVDEGGKDGGEGADAPTGPRPVPDEATLLDLYRRYWNQAGQDLELTDELLRRFTLLPLVVANRSERFNQYYLDDPHFRFEPRITEAHYFLFPLASGKLVLFPSPALLRHLRVQERDSLGERAYCKYIYEISGQERDVMVQSPAWCAILGGQPLEGQVVVDERGNADRV